MSEHKVILDSDGRYKAIPTSGLWHIHDNGVPELPHYWEILSDGGRHICHFPKLVPEFRKMQADDARLISVAPVLFSVLADLLSEAEQQGYKAEEYPLIAIGTAAIEAAQGTKANIASWETADRLAKALARVLVWADPMALPNCERNEADVTEAQLAIAEYNGEV